MRFVGDRSQFAPRSFGNEASTAMVIATTRTFCCMLGVGVNQEPSCSLADICSAASSACLFADIPENHVANGAH